MPRRGPATPDETVAMIKAIVYQDKRERLAAGFRYGSHGLVHRIAEAFGMKPLTVQRIKEGKRRRKVPTKYQAQRGLTVSQARLDKIRAFNAKKKRRAEMMTRHQVHYWPRFLQKDRGRKA